MPSRTPRRAATLTIKIGRLIEAHATGWAVFAVPFVVVAALLAGLAQLWLR